MSTYGDILGVGRLTLKGGGGDRWGFKSSQIDMARPKNRHSPYLEGGGAGDDKLPDPN